MRFYTLYKKCALHRKKCRGQSKRCPQTMKLITVYIKAARAAAAGTVMIHAATMVAKCDLRTSFRLRNTS